MVQTAKATEQTENNKEKTHWKHAMYDFGPTLYLPHSENKRVKKRSFATNLSAVDRTQFINSAGLCLCVCQWINEKECI